MGEGWCAPFAPPMCIRAIVPSEGGAERVGQPRHQAVWPCVCLSMFMYAWGGRDGRTIAPILQVSKLRLEESESHGARKGQRQRVDWASRPLAQAWLSCWGKGDQWVL